MLNRYLILHGIFLWIWTIKLFILQWLANTKFGDIKFLRVSLKLSVEMAMNGILMGEGECSGALLLLFETCENS
jgi:hypothetical protein